MHIRPDLIKLDRSLIEGIDADETRAALVESFVHFARQIGAGLCAEGVETREELRALSDLEVMTAQGYLLARPGAPWVGVSADALAAHDDELAGITRAA
jgi:EAL domain-containing protein (putative c-di-GMP-specific phosphodiesterase class I)